LLHSIIYRREKIPVLWAACHPQIKKKRAKAEKLEALIEKLQKHFNPKHELGIEIASTLKEYRA
jgi:hypothetical protein